MTIRPLTRILETAIYVDDVDDAAKFYGMLLQVQPYARDSKRHVFFKLKSGMFLLFNPKETSTSGDLPAHGAWGGGHVAFEIEHDELESWRMRLAILGIEVEKEHHWPSGGRSLYFRDPFGNSLELATADTWPDIESSG